MTLIPLWVEPKFITKDQLVCLTPTNLSNFSFTSITKKGKKENFPV
ncbi:hypothetical protein HMPREF9423_1017 [Streptococcus infantis ATCC 700779]|uniref:Uncharacterized protein n=1 Tax=Streptococcus infantis ATCC 700779 TaxID=889204 RepID=E8K0K4_9STRE|nr:hypothetical protein HMPREF9423_1017 [Streptococcus infantis ATCC 700779]